MARRYQQQDEQSPQEQQLVQLLQLAQLQKLMSEPGREQQQLDQLNEHQRMAAAIQLLNLHQEQQNQGEQRRLQELGITETARSREDQHDTTMKLGVLHSLVSDPMTPLEMKMKYAASISPEMATLIKADHAEKVQSAVKNHLEGFKSVAAKGNPEALSAFKTMNQIPDEAWEQMKSALPETIPPPQTQLPSATPGYDPEATRELGRAIKYLPIDLANTSESIWRRVFAPPLNLVNSAIGLPPVPTNPKPDPRDYGILWDKLLRKQ